ncbi:hypothetical protein BCR44DRAFT_327249 [Catenaria anguillulae PL171]|uniref:Uncharacterized protein n=1 Tax=Catenaria anguillulae PL171 TaxID=765915 RepID=A0A1Y2HRB4_9FUNG|nr:hypothetical protein BCR44DRAFT_327249 [Catenaria anguillulae PL171]
MADQADAPSAGNDGRLNTTIRWQVPLLSSDCVSTCAVSSSLALSSRFKISSRPTPAHVGMGKHQEKGGKGLRCVQTDAAGKPIMFVCGRGDDNCDFEVIDKARLGWELHTTKRQTVLTVGNPHSCHSHSSATRQSIPPHQSQMQLGPTERDPKGRVQWSKQAQSPMWAEHSTG